jgi:flagellar basal body P-ring formation protein FlgA
MIPGIIKRRNLFLIALIPFGGPGILAGSNLAALLEPLPGDISNPPPGMAYRHPSAHTNVGSGASFLDPVNQAPAPSARQSGKPPRREERVPENQTVRVHFNEFAQLLEEQIQDKLSTDAGLEVSPAQPFPGLTLRSHAWELELLHLTSHTLRSRMVAEVRFLVDGEEAARLSLPLRCRLFRPVFFPLKRIERGEMLSSSDFVLREVDVLDMRGGPVTGEVSLNHYELTRTIEVDRPLLWRDLAEIPAVRKGQVVEVQINEGLLNIKMKAVALQNGLSGELIRLRNLRTNKEIQALITNENEIRVYF